MKKFFVAILSLVLFLNLTACDESNGNSTDRNSSEHNKEEMVNKTETQADAEQKAKEEAELEVEQRTKEETESKREAEEKQKATANSLGLVNAVVSRVIDGDTVQLSDGTRVRMVGVNTPESTTRTETYGKEASNYSKSKLEGKTVWLQKDVSETDRYGRKLRLIWLEVPSSLDSEKEIRSKMFNADLVLNGYAEPATYPPDVRYSNYFVQFAKEARNQNKGLWAYGSEGTTKGDLDSSNSNSTNNSSSSNSSSSSSSSNSSNTSNSDSCDIKGNISSSGEKIYHMPGQQFYDMTKPEEMFCSEEEAQKAGYRASKR